MFYLQMNNGDTLNDFNACEARIDIWRRTILVDPLEDVFNGACVLHSLAVARNSCGRMKRRSHELPVTCTRTRDVRMHRASDRVMLDEVGIGSRMRSGEIVGLVGRKGGGVLGSYPTPGYYLVPESEDGVLLFVFAAVNWKSLSRLPTPDGAFASIEIIGDLLPRFQSFLWS